MSADILQCPKCKKGTTQIESEGDYKESRHTCLICDEKWTVNHAEAIEKEEARLKVEEAAFDAMTPDEQDKVLDELQAENARYPVGSLLRSYDYENCDDYYYEGILIAIEGDRYTLAVNKRVINRVSCQNFTPKCPVRRES